MAKLRVSKVQPLLLVNLNEKDIASRKVPIGYLRQGAEFLAEQVASADQVTLVSAYYGVGFLVDTLTAETVKKRKSKRMRILLGRAAPPAIEAQRAELVELCDGLLKRGYAKKNLSIRIAPEGRFFHTKIYQFRSGSKQTTLVGSANVSERGFGGNDEILVALSGKHTSLDSYIEQTWLASMPLEDIKPGKMSVVHSFEAMLRDGLLYFQPPRSLSASVECFPPAKYKRIAETLRRQGAALPFTEQTGITSINCLRLLDIKLSEPEDDEKVKGFQMPTYSIQTVFGYWAPAAYESLLNELIEGHAAQRREELLRAGKALRSVKPALVDRRLEEFFDAVDTRLARGKVSALSKEQKAEVTKHVSHKIERLTKALSNTKALDRLSRRFIGTPVPELWEDPRSSDDLIGSFCEYIAAKPGKARGGRQIVKFLAERFQLAIGDDADDVRRKIELAFSKGAQLASIAWPKPKKNVRL